MDCVIYIRWSSSEQGKGSSLERQQDICRRHAAENQWTVVDELVEEGLLPDELRVEGREPLGFLIHESGAHSVIDAAYRYCRHSDGPDVVLFGTGNPEHLKANAESILSPPLPEADVDRLEALFGMLTDVGLDAPGRVKG